MGLKVQFLRCSKNGRSATARAAWPQRRGGGLSLETGRPRGWHVLGRIIARARCACNISSSGYPLRIPSSTWRFARRRDQRHGRFQERTGLEMYTVSCATSRLLPRPRVSFSRRVGSGQDGGLVQLQPPRRDVNLPLPRGPLVSVSSRPGRVRELLPQLRVRALEPGYDGAPRGAPALLADSTSWASFCAIT